MDDCRIAGDDKVQIKDVYDRISGNYEEARRRLMTEEVVIYFAEKFPGDPSFEELTRALKDHNRKDAFRAAHSLKGVCLNLAFTKLAEAASVITELLRPEDADLKEARAFYPELQEEYERVRAAIGEFRKGRSVDGEEV